MILIFDTETTGLPKNWKAPMTKLDNWPRVIQLSWIVTSNIGLETSRGNYLIRPDGWVIPKDKFWIDNGFSTEKSLEEGKELSHILKLFISDLQHCTHIVSHNMSFDYNVLGAEMIRYKMKSDVKPVRICTKESSTNYCKLPSPYGYKWPKLIELHQHLFGKGFEGAHDALSDVIACKDCLFELIERGIINLSN